MERNYKPNKNSKLQNLFLCQKQILKLKSKLLNLIESPCPTFQQVKKSSIINEVNHKPKSTSRSQNKLKRNRENIGQPLKQTRQNIQAKSKRTLCPCNSYWIQSGVNKKRLFISQSPKKTNKSKKKTYKTSHTQSQSPQKYKKPKPLRTESTTQNNTDSALRTPKQNFKRPQMNSIKKTISVNYSFQDSIIISTPQSKNKGSKIKIEQQESFLKDFSQVKRVSKVQPKESFVSPLNSKYFKAYQQSRMTNQQRQRYHINQSPKQMNLQSQQAFYLDDESQTSRIKLSRQSQHEFMSTGMTANKNIISPDKKIHTERQPITNRNRRHPVQTDLDLLKDICQKTERFMTQEIYPFRQVLSKTQTSTIETQKKPSDTKLMNKISNFGLWFNNDSELYSL